MGTNRASKTAILMEINAGILGFAHDSSAEEASEWEFFCECGRSDCHEVVTLSPDAYDAIHGRGAAVLAPRHKLSQVERAKRLREEAKALRAQAAHQARRARKNIKHGA